MKLVIDIPKEVKEAFDKADEINFCFYDYNSMIGKAIRNGTPLPKGHGRIADMDEAIKCIEEVKGDDAIYAIALIEWACAKRTVIEADKE